MSEVGSVIIEGLQEAVAHAKGCRTGARRHKVRIPKSVDVTAIRMRQKLNQEEFAARYGFSVASVRNWEQGRRRPEGPARVLLTIIDREEDAVLRALQVSASRIRRTRQEAERETTTKRKRAA